LDWPSDRRSSNPHRNARSGWSSACRAYPTYLYFNPHRQSKQVRLAVDTAHKDLYDAVGNQFIAEGVQGDVLADLAPDAAAVIVLAPAGGLRVHRVGRLLVEGVVVDYTP
jgi:hypothetical protein